MSCGEQHICLQQQKVPNVGVNHRKIVKLQQNFTPANFQNLKLEILFEMQIKMCNFLHQSTNSPCAQIHFISDYNVRVSKEIEPKVFFYPEQKKEPKIEQEQTSFESGSKGKLFQKPKRISDLFILKNPTYSMSRGKIRLKRRGISETVCNMGIKVSCSNNLKKI